MVCNRIADAADVKLTARKYFFVHLLFFFLQQYFKLEFHICRWFIAAVFLRNFLHSFFCSAACVAHLLLLFFCIFITIVTSLLRATNSGVSSCCCSGTLNFNSLMTYFCGITNVQQKLRFIHNRSD